MWNIRAEEYRRKASACREQAEKASYENAAGWRDLAQRWDEAAEKVEGFDVDQRRRLDMLQGARPSTDSSALPHTSLYQIGRPALEH